MSQTLFFIKYLKLSFFLNRCSCSAPDELTPKELESFLRLSKGIRPLYVSPLSLSRNLWEIGCSSLSIMVMKNCILEWKISVKFTLGTVCYLYLDVFFCRIQEKENGNKP